MTSHPWSFGLRSRRGSAAAWIALALATGAAGYQLGQSSRRAFAAENVEVLLEADRAFDRETNARRLDGWLDFFSPEGRMFPEGRDVLQGKAAIAELMTPLFANPAASLRWEPVGGDIAASGDLGYTFGHSTFRQPDANGATSEHPGKYVTIWKKQPDGSWKVVLDIGNSRPRR